MTQRFTQSIELNGRVIFAAAAEGGPQSCLIIGRFWHFWIGFIFSESHLRLCLQVRCAHKCPEAHASLGPVCEPVCLLFQVMSLLGKIRNYNYAAAEALKSKCAVWFCFLLKAGNG